VALNIKNSEVEQLAEELARLAGTSKTEIIRQALLAHRERVAALGQDGSREERLRDFLELRVWPTIPPEAGRRWTRDEEDAAVGYGEFGEPV